MLQISDAAEVIMRRIRQQSNVPDSWALRIGAVEIAGSGVGIGFAFTDSPEEGDQTISERDGFRVYLSRELAIPFSDAALEATSNEEGITLQQHSPAELLDRAHQLR